MRINDKDPWEWTESELQSLVDNGVPEAVGLEYKRSDSLGKADSKRREISKDISAMANSDGGVVIYGVKTHSEREKKHIPEDFDEGISASQVSIEWLEQVASSNIQASIDGLRFCPIELKVKPTGRFVYVVYVPKSTRAHQAADKKYYGRIERTTTALEDYQIRDINNRLKHPVLMPHFTLTTVNKRDNIVEYNFEVYLENTGTVRARDWQLELDIPNQIKYRLSGTKDVILVERKARTSKIRINLGASAKVIFPQDKQKVFVGHNWGIGSFDFNDLAEKRVIAWKVFADDSPPRHDKTKFLSIELDGEEIRYNI